jgi:cobalt-zinc-cadmium resistance protein CzcA
MLNWIIDFSLQNRKLVLLFSLLLIVTGVFAMRRLSIDAFPDVTDVMVQINTTAPALSPEEIEKQISARVEQAMAGIPNLKLVRSLSKFGLSQVTVVFKDGTDLYFARAQVLERLQAVELPTGMERPVMGPIATGLGEIYHYVITSPSHDLTEARIIHDWVIKPQLMSVAGVAEINSWGGFEKQFQVVVSPFRLIKYGLAIQDVLAALQESNMNVGGGNVGAAGEILLVSGRGIVTNTREIAQIVIVAYDGRPVRICDVAEVVEGHALRRGVVTAEGRGEVVLGLGFMLMGENSHEIARRLRERLAEVKKNVPPGTDIRVVYDRTELVDLVIRTVKKNLFEGALLVVAILFLFLGNFRAALIVALAIPLSMLFAFNIMVRTGVAGTLMSLGAIDFGLIVDSSVIMIENSMRCLHEDSANRSVIQVVAAASKEVRKPTLFGELIIMIVYLPLLALESVEGKLFQPMALTVIFALTGSLILSLTLTPVLASYLLPRHLAQHADPYVIRLLKRVYRPAVRFAVENRVLTLGCALIVMLGTVPIALKLGTIFVPRLDEGSVVINTVRLPGVSIEESARFSTAIERLLQEKFPHEIASIWTRTGTPEVATDPMGIEVSDVFIMLTPRHQWQQAKTKDELVNAIDKVLKPLPGMNYSFTQPIEMRFNEMISGVRTDLGVKIFGDNFITLKDLGERVRAILASVPGASNPFLEPLVGQPILEIVLDQEALSRYGLRASEVLDIIEALGGKEAGEVRIGEMRFPLAVRLPARYSENPALVQTIIVMTTNGQRIPLAKLAKIKRSSGPMVINREWMKRRAVVTCNVMGRDLGSFVAEARQRIQVELGEELQKLGYRIEFGGQFENLERASKRLAIIVPLAFTLVFFLLFATYGNLADSLRVFTGVPFAIVGGAWALYLRELPFSISAAVGFIALSGISVLADMIMVHTIRQFINMGCSVKEAALNAAERRLRPVLMTALVASLGFMPMAFNTGVGAEVQCPLATVVIGGLLSSTLLTLFVLPTLYVTLRQGVLERSFNEK